MHNYSQLEPLVAERIRSRLEQAEESRLAHRARVDSKAERKTRGEAGSKKLRLPLLDWSLTRIRCGTPGIRLHGRA